MVLGGVRLQVLTVVIGDRLKFNDWREVVTRSLTLASLQIRVTVLLSTSLVLQLLLRPHIGQIPATMRSHKLRARKATWLAFGLIALAASSAAQPPMRDNALSLDNVKPNPHFPGFNSY